MRTHYFWQYPLGSYMLSDNGIVCFGVVRQWNCLVWCCRTMELFGLIVTTLYNFCCPRVTQLFHSPRADTTFSSSPWHNFMHASANTLKSILCVWNARMTTSASHYLLPLLSKSAQLTGSDTHNHLRKFLPNHLLCFRTDSFSQTQHLSITKKECLYT